MRHALLAAAALSAACATTSTTTAQAPAAASSAEASGITFIENDLPKALALAKTQGTPLFVDAWAPW